MQETTFAVSGNSRQMSKIRSRNYRVFRLLDIIGARENENFQIQIFSSFVWSV